MKLLLDKTESGLLSSTKHWFDPTHAPSVVINQIVGPSAVGIYCLWWKNVDLLPLEKTVALPAGKRGTVDVHLKRWLSPIAGAIAVYVGKGSIRTRLLSHVKPPRPSDEGRQSRNPFQWVATIFNGVNAEDVIRRNLGFSFIEEKNKLEQVYVENLAIGLLKPWFNFRLTS